MANVAVVFSMEKCILIIHERHYKGTDSIKKQKGDLSGYGNFNYTYFNNIKHHVFCFQAETEE